MSLGEENRTLKSDNWRNSNAYSKVERIIGYIIFSLFAIYFIFSITEMLVKTRVSIIENNFSEYIEIEIRPKNNIMPEEYTVFVNAKEDIDELFVEIEIEFKTLDDEWIVKNITLSGDVSKNQFLCKDIDLQALSIYNIYKILSIKGEAIL